MSDTSTEFRWEGRSTATIGELLDEAARAEREGKAAAFLDAYRATNPHADANLGYLIGYLEPAETRRRMYRSYALEHPIFGSQDL